MLQRVQSFFCPVRKNQKIQGQAETKPSADMEWFAAAENTVHWDRREFLQEPFIPYLIKNKIISLSEINTMKRNDLQKLDLAFELGLFEGSNSMTKEQILSSRVDDLMKLKILKIESDEKALLPLPVDLSFDLMQRECLKESLPVQKLLEEGKLTLSDIDAFDVEDFAKFDYESVCQLFSDGVLTLEQIKACSVFECKKFDLEVIQDVLRSGDLSPEQIVWDSYRRTILGIETKVEIKE